MINLLSEKKLADNVRMKFFVVDNLADSELSEQLNHNTLVTVYSIADKKYFRANSNNEFIEIKKGGGGSGEGEYAYDPTLDYDGKVFASNNDQEKGYLADKLFVKEGSGLSLTATETNLELDINLKENTIDSCETFPFSCIYTPSATSFGNFLCGSVLDIQGKFKFRPETTMTVYMTGGELTKGHFFAVLELQDDGKYKIVAKSNVSALTLTVNANNYEITKPLSNLISPDFTTDASKFYYAAIISPNQLSSSDAQPKFYGLINWGTAMGGLKPLHSITNLNNSSVYNGGDYLITENIGNNGSGNFYFKLNY